MRIRSGVCLSLCLGWLAGCGGAGGSGTGVAARPVDPKRDANEVVAEAVGRQAVLTSLAGDGVLSLVDPASKLNHRVNAEVVAADRQKLRISGGRMGVHAFDLLMYDNEVLFHDALGKKVYSGTTADLRYLALPIQPEEVLNQLLKPATELIYLSWQPDASRKGDPAGGVAYVAGDGRQSYRMVVDRRTSLVSRIEVYDGPASGQTPYMVRTFGQYRTVPVYARPVVNAAVAEGPKVFPYQQRIEWPRERRQVEFTFKKVVPDAPLAQDDFNVSYSDRAQQLPLGQAGVDPRGFEELSMR